MLLGASNAQETMYPKINFCERLTDRQVMHKTNIDSKKRWQQSRMKPSKAPAPFLYSSIFAARFCRCVGLGQKDVVFEWIAI